MRIPGSAKRIISDALQSEAFQTQIYQKAKALLEERKKSAEMEKAASRYQNFFNNLALEKTLLDAARRPAPVMQDPLTESERWISGAVQGLGALLGARPQFTSGAARDYAALKQDAAARQYQADTNQYNQDQNLARVRAGILENRLGKGERMADQAQAALESTDASLGQLELGRLTDKLAGVQARQQERRQLEQLREQLAMKSQADMALEQLKQGEEMSRLRDLAQMFKSSGLNDADATSQAVMALYGDNIGRAATPEASIRVAELNRQGRALVADAQRAVASINKAARDNATAGQQAVAEAQRRTALEKQMASDLTKALQFEPGPERDQLIQQIKEIYSNIGTEQTKATAFKHDFNDISEQAANRYGVPVDIIDAVIYAESRGRLKAVSPVGARGLMQLMPGTAKQLGVTDSFDPVQNIDGGTRYLAQQLVRFNGRLDLALAAYNAGPGRVAKSNRVPAIKETQDYVAKIMARLGYKYKPGDAVTLPKELLALIMLNLQDKKPAPSPKPKPASGSVAKDNISKFFGGQ